MRGADVADRGAGGPVAQLAEVAAALADHVAREPAVALGAAQAEHAAGQGDQQGRRADRGAEAQRAGRQQRVVEDQGDADGDQGQGRQRDRAAHQQARPSSSQPPTGPTPKPRNSVTPEEDGQGHQAEAHELARLVGARPAASACARGWPGGGGGCGVRAGCRWLPPGDARGRVRPGSRPLGIGGRGARSCPPPCVAGGADGAFRAMRRAARGRGVAGCPGSAAACAAQRRGGLH